MNHTKPNWTIPILIKSKDLIWVKPDMSCTVTHSCFCFKWVHQSPAASQSRNWIRTCKPVDTLRMLQREKSWVSGSQALVSIRRYAPIIEGFLHWVILDFFEIVMDDRTDKHTYVLYCAMRNWKIISSHETALSNLEFIVAEHLSWKVIIKSIIKPDMNGIQLNINRLAEVFSQKYVEA